MVNLLLQDVTGHSVHSSYRISLTLHTEFSFDFSLFFCHTEFRKIYVIHNQRCMFYAITDSRR